MPITTRFDGDAAIDQIGHCGERPGRWSPRLTTALGGISWTFAARFEMSTAVPQVHSKPVPLKVQQSQDNFEIVLQEVCVQHTNLASLKADVSKTTDDDTSDCTSDCGQKEPTTATTQVYSNSHQITNNGE